MMKKFIICAIFCVAVIVFAACSDTAETGGNVDNADVTTLNVEGGGDRKSTRLNSSH